MYDYGFRIYDPRIAKFLSVDPLTASYPMLTPYQFASNTPIMAIDLDGLEAYVVIENDGVGHAFIALPTAEGITVYSYGRYNGSYTPFLGGLAPFGDGVLLKYTGDEAKEYLKKRLSLGDGKTTNVYFLPDADQQAITKYYEDLYQQGKDLPKTKVKDGKEEPNPYYGDGKIVDTYSIVGSSCVTKTCDAIEESGALEGTNAQKALDAGGTILPQSVGTILNTASDNNNVKNDPASKDKVQNVTESLKQEYGIK